MIQRTIIWSLVALLVGVAIGFGFRAPIANRLSLDAAQRVTLFSPDEENCIKIGGIWTGTGCVKQWTWTPRDWSFFTACITSAYATPPPPLPAKEVTNKEYINCVRLTEIGKGR